MVKGEIWRAHLPFPRGSEPANDRPVLVIQGDEFNSSKISTVICAVITTNLELAKSPPNFIKIISMLPKQFIEKIDKALLTIFDIRTKI